MAGRRQGQLDRAQRRLVPGGPDRGGGQGSPLTATSNGKTIGPEVGFGYVMGTYHDAQVLLIKTAMGNRALGFDFRPPSSGPTQCTEEGKNGSRSNTS